MSEQITIKFSAIGTVTQTIKFPDTDEGRSNKRRIVDMLNSGEALTTVQEDGSVFLLPEMKDIGVVVDVDNEMAYSDFEEKD